MKTNLLGIYVFESKISGFRYIGQSRNLEARRKEHLCSLARGSHHSRHFQRSYLAHGKESFEYSILEYCNNNELTLREQYWLDFYRPTGLYNSAPAADSNIGVKRTMEMRKLQSLLQIGRKHSQETKEKIRAAHLGKKFSDQHVENMRLTRLGKIQTAESRAKMSVSRLGRKFTPEHIANMNKSKIGRKHTPEAIEKMRLIKTGKIRLPESNAKMIATKLRNQLLKQIAIV